MIKGQYAQLRLSLKIASSDSILLALPTVFSIIIASLLVVGQHSNWHTFVIFLLLFCLYIMGIVFYYTIKAIMENDIKISLENRLDAWNVLSDSIVFLTLPIIFMLDTLEFNPENVLLGFTLEFLILLSLTLTLISASSQIKNFVFDYFREICKNNRTLEDVVDTYHHRLATEEESIEGSFSLVKNFYKILYSQKWLKRFLGLFLLLLLCLILIG